MKNTILKLATFLVFIIGIISCNHKSVYIKGPSVMMAEGIMHRYSNPDSFPWKSWSYSQSYMLMGIEKVWENTGDNKFFDYILKYARIHVDSSGNTPRFKCNTLDDCMVGTTLIWAYRHTKNPRYLPAINRVKDCLGELPMTSDSIYWHNRWTKGEVWIDGLFVGQIFMLNYGKYIGNSIECYTSVVNQLTRAHKHLKKGESGLLYHAWDEDRDAVWANRETGNSPDVWSEGLGWYSLIIADALQTIPDGFKGKDSVRAIAANLVNGLLNYQDTTNGLWYDVVDKPGEENNFHDASGSAMFLYLLIKAKELKLADADLLSKRIKKAYEGLLSKTKANPSDGFPDLYSACDGVCVQKSYEDYVKYPQKVNAKEAVAGYLWATATYEGLQGKSVK